MSHHDPVVRWYRDVSLLRSNIDARQSGSNITDLRSRFSPCFAIVVSLIAGERGPRCESLQSPDRDRCTAPQTGLAFQPLPSSAVWKISRRYLQLHKIQSIALANHLLFSAVNTTK